MISGAELAFMSSFSSWSLSFVSVSAFVYQILINPVSFLLIFFKLLLSCIVFELTLLKMLCVFNWPVLHKVASFALSGVPKTNDCN